MPNTGYNRGVLSSMEEANNRERRSSDYLRSSKLPINLRTAVQQALISDPSATGLTAQAERLYADHPFDSQATQLFQSQMEQQRQQQAAQQAKLQQQYAEVKERRRAAGAANPVGVGSINGQAVYVPSFGGAPAFDAQLNQMRGDAIDEGIRPNFGPVSGGFTAGGVPLAVGAVDVLRGTTTATKKAREIAAQTAQRTHDLALQGLKNEGEVAKATATQGGKVALQTDNLLGQLQKFGASSYDKYLNAFTSKLLNGASVVNGGARVSRPLWEISENGKPLGKAAREEERRAAVQRAHQKATQEGIPVKIVDGGMRLEPLTQEDFLRSPQYERMLAGTYSPSTMGKDPSTLWKLQALRDYMHSVGLGGEAMAPSAPPPVVPPTVAQAQPAPTPTPTPTPKAMPAPGTQRGTISDADMQVLDQYVAAGKDPAAILAGLDINDPGDAAAAAYLRAKYLRR